MSLPDLAAIELLKTSAETLILGEPIVHVDDRGEEQTYWPLCFEEETASDLYYQYSAQAGRFGEITVLMAGCRACLRSASPFGSTYTRTYTPPRNGSISAL